MRISDWSSDVCPSDLVQAQREVVALRRRGALLREPAQLRVQALAGFGARLQQFGQVQRVGEQAGAADLGQARCSGVAIAIVEILPVEEGHQRRQRSEEHTSELQSLMRTPYAVFCLTQTNPHTKPG